MTPNERILALLHQYPDPVRLLRKAFPGCVWQAVALGMDRDELHSACLYGLVRGAARYDPGGGKFSTYAPWAMRHAVEEDLYRAQRDIDRLDGGTVAPLVGDAAGRPGGHGGEVDRADLVAVVRERVAGLPDQERDLVRAAFGIEVEARTITSLAEDLGVVRNTVRARLDAAMGKLRAVLTTGC